MIKRFFKKHNKKIIAFIGVLATTICGVLGLTKTYAYETDKMSYTITQIGSTNNNYQSITDNTNYIDISYDNENRLYLKNENKFSYKQYYILINFSYLDDNAQVTIRNMTNRVLLTPYFVNSNNNNRASQGVYANTYQYNINSTYDYYTICIPMVFTSNWNETMEYIYLTNWFFLGSNNGTSLSSYDYRIYNIDLVSYEDIGLSQYYETYYSNIENQYNQLQQDFNDLEDNYNDLQDDYDTLEDNYDTLEDNYNTLQDEYDELSDDYRNLYFNTNYGIWNFLSYEIVTLNNPIYSSNDTETYRYEGYTHWVKDDIIELNKLNVTKAITRNFIGQTPPFTIQCDDWNINMNFSVYNHPAYIYYQLPTDTLDLQIDTNINFNNFVDVNTSNYILFMIRLSNYDNYTTGNYIDLPISMDFFNRNGFRITKENLQEEFSQYDLNYYNNIMSIFIASNYQLNTEDKFDIISTNAVIDRDYQLGYADGRASMSDTISGLQTEVASLKGEITRMQLIINSLNDEVNSTSNDYNLNNLIWTIGGTPFESFKHIWNVNFFGVNVADFILGFITTFLGLFIFKKFFF